MDKNIPSQNQSFSLGWGYIDETFSPDILPNLLETALHKYWYSILQYNDSRGLSDLRVLISQFIKEIYSLDVGSDEILVTNGSTASIDLIGRVVLGGVYDSLAFEPLYDTALESLLLNSKNLHTISLSHKRNDSIAWVEFEHELSKPNTKLLYINPHFHNPTGATLSIQEKQKILDLCKQYNTYILEDDPYGFYDFSSNDELSKTSMRSLDIDGDTVFYINSFSKIFFPGIRIGYIIAPRQFYSQLNHYQKYTTSSPNLLMQGIIIEALKSGTIEKSMNYYKGILAEKYKKLQESLKHYKITEFFDFTGGNGGFFIWGKVKTGNNINTDKLLGFAEKHGTTFVPGSKYFRNGGTDQLRLSYGQISSDNIDEATSRLSHALQEYISSST